MKIKIAGIEPISFVDGQGLRYAIFTQGCSHNCYKCHNPETHDFEGGSWRDVDEIIEDISNYPGIRGITLTGGDPLYSDNYKAVVELCRRYKEKYPNKTIWLYTGYEYEMIKEFDIMEYIDILVDGRFIEQLKSLELKFRGSANQRIIDVKRSLVNNSLVLWSNN